MKVTILKISRRKEVINREELTNVAMAIREGSVAKEVKLIRQVYHLMRTERQEDGQVLTDFSTDINLPRICFAAEYAHKNHERLMVNYNGLVVLELNGLDSYEQAVTFRNQASKMPETLMAFLGGSGKSVKIVCRGELYEKGSLPKEEEEIRQFHRNLYETARLAYQNQFQMNIEYLEPRLDRTVYLSADPEMFFNPEARAFLADTKKPEQQEPVNISEESDSLMPGRTIDRTYHLNWLFIVNNVLGRYFELPDEQREMELLMRVATACLNEGIPMAQAQQLTLSHPVLGRDEILVRNIFDSVYAVTLQEDYLEKHPFKPLKSVPEETIQAMRTEIFLNANFFMRKNLMTGVAEYRERYSNDQTYKPLTEEVRNDMTLRAVELGLKAWDKNVNRFIDSTRIEQYDPVNTWLDKLPQWDGHDYIKELAGRVPTDQPHWEKYLKMWLTGMDLLSSADVKFRPPYGKTIKQYRRYTSFIGTTNKRKPLTDPTGSRRFACIGVTGHINYDDSLNHQQLFAQALHLFNNGERFWLNDVEIAELIKENECYQQLYTLEEMIAGTFRSPKPSEEARWLSIDEIKEILSCYYASFDPGISNTAMGNALNDTQFNFEVRRTNQGKVYRMVEQ